MTPPTTSTDSLSLLLRTLKLPSFRAHFEEVGAMAEREGWSFTRFLHHLAELEMQGRQQRRIERYLQQSHLPATKTLATLNLKKLPTKVRRLLPRLCAGQFVDEATNVLAFGLPGRGKTHLLSAIGHELVRQGRRVLFTSAYALVQRLLVAKRDYGLERELRRLDGFAAVIIDDLGYVQQERGEMEVLFTFLGERYERRSVLLSSNLVFSQWDRIFGDPMTTAAAIDRLVHHSEILEMNGPSVRAEEAGLTTTTTKQADDNYQETASKKREKRATGKESAATTTGEM
ncbi:MAG TPA: AAA family ATPase [Planctomycetes bacterium]|nr:AAA family ATPase [Planctomycetota bacterium]